MHVKFEKKNRKNEILYNERKRKQHKQSKTTMVIRENNKTIQNVILQERNLFIYFKA